MEVGRLISVFGMMSLMAESGGGDGDQHQPHHQYVRLQLEDTSLPLCLGVHQNLLLILIARNAYAFPSSRHRPSGRT